MNILTPEKPSRLSELLTSVTPTLNRIREFALNPTTAVTVDRTSIINSNNNNINERHTSTEDTTLPPISDIKSNNVGGECALPNGSRYPPDRELGHATSTDTTGNSSPNNQRNQDASTINTVPHSDEGRTSTNNVERTLALSSSPSSQRTDAAQHAGGRRRVANSGNQTNTNNKLQNDLGYVGIGNQSINNSPHDNHTSSLFNDEASYWPVGGSALGGINTNNVTTARGSAGWSSASLLLEGGNSFASASSSGGSRLLSLTYEPGVAQPTTTDELIAGIAQANEADAARKSHAYFGDSSNDAGSSNGCFDDEWDAWKAATQGASLFGDVNSAEDYDSVVLLPPEKTRHPVKKARYPVDPEESFVSEPVVSIADPEESMPSCLVAYDSSANPGSATTTMSYDESYDEDYDVSFGESIVVDTGANASLAPDDPFSFFSDTADENIVAGMNYVHYPHTSRGTEGDKRFCY